MRIGFLFVVLIMFAIAVKMMSSRVKIEDPFIGEYEHASLRTLVLKTSRNVEELIAPLQQWARDNGYKFRVGSPTGAAGSISFQIWNGLVVLLGSNRSRGDLTPLPELEFSAYLNSDAIDDQMLDQIAEQLRTILAPFGLVEVTSAPPGMQPRSESTNTWRRR